MSFTSDEMQRLQSYINQDYEAASLFQKFLQSQEMERHKICHELRNPLTLVYSTVQLIESQHPEVRTFAYWESLCGDLEYMMHLLEDFSQFNNSTLIHPESFSFRSFMEKLSLSFAASCADSKVEFTSCLPDKLPMFTGDPVKLRQALLNLFKNAVESIHDSGSVSLNVWSKDQNLHILIKDTGCGMSEEQLKEIFTPFFTSKASGTGLGLPVTQNIILAHRGTLTVSSHPGYGTEFEITLPVEPDMKKPANCGDTGQG